MLAPQISRTGDKNAPLSTRLGLHLDALRIGPATYLKAVWWWLLGKRLRSRLTLAPLLGRSPRAYAIWQARETLPPVPASTAPVITALLTHGEDDDEGKGEDLTRASLLQEGIAVLRPGQLQVTGEGWLLPIRIGDVLAPGAGNIYRAAAASVSPDVHVIYADDDLSNENGDRVSPHFKPDWNAELYRHFDYLTGACIVRVDAGSIAGVPAKSLARALVDKALITSAPARALHLPHILHHRQRRPLPRRPAASVLSARQRAALPPISVIVPTRNRVDLLQPCLEGVASTDYPSPIEILVIDNGSDDPATLDYLSTLDPAFARVLSMPGPFNFAALNNEAATQASGELLCLLNNDIEITEPDWLTTMAHQAIRDGVGAVGAQLLYPDGRIQHAGVVTGIGGAACHAHRLLWPDDEGYFHRHALPQFTTAVTAACMVMKRERFLAVDGFDAEKFRVAFNDVDLCLKLNARGWQSLYEPRATLVHHESVSRGLDRDPAGAARLSKELEALNEKWSTSTMRDPFHHPALSRFSERFVIEV